MMRVLDLFSGIGGFSLGLERTGGFETAAFCEIDEKARKVLRRHWPDVPIFTDVSTLTAEVVHETAGTIDVVTGGFPCQDISVAGKGVGLSGARSGLWFHMHRIIEEVRPRYAIIENVSALRSRGLDVVLRGIAALGYDAEWHCIPASAVGAPHQRDRIWIIAYSDSNLVGRDGRGDHRRRRQIRVDEERDSSASLPNGKQPQFNAGSVGEILAHTEGDGRIEEFPDSRGRVEGAASRQKHRSWGIREALADAENEWLDRRNRKQTDHAGEGRLRGAEPGRGFGNEWSSSYLLAGGVRQIRLPGEFESNDVADTASSVGARRLDEANERARPSDSRLLESIRRSAYWEVEPDVGRVAHGVPGRVDRIKQLGNAVVPQIPELIGYAILRREYLLSE